MSGLRRYSTGVKSIAFYVGANTYFNVTRVISNHGWMLSDNFDLDLVTTTPEAYTPATKDYYSVYGDCFGRNRFGHAASLWRYLRNNSPDVIVPATRPVLYGSLVSPLTLFNGVKYVYRHSGEIFKYYESLRGWRKALCYGVRNVGGRFPLSVADRYVALGPAGKRSLVNNGIDPELVSILPPTISPDRFNSNDGEVPERLNRFDRDIVLFLGRRTRMKGIHVMEYAIPAVLQERHDLQFVFVGGGDREPVLPEFVRDHVTIVGSVPPSEVPSYLAASDILVLPSLSEGIPRVLLESLYMETPVLASNVGDVPEVTDNTYRSTDEFVHELINYEQLSVDPIGPFLRSSAKNDYIDFFNLASE